MGEMRKITVEVDDKDLRAAQTYTGEGVSDTIRTALKQLRSMQAQRELLKLRGKVKFSMSWREMKHDRE